ncbi:MAG: M28 family peptidase [Candidatus Aminicenantes bacterium]|nr:M28 family peptidase [Candidatus Aminicenantes bacterium]
MRFYKKLLTGAVILAIALPLASDDMSRKRIEASIRFLADDLLEGRGTPSRGLEVSALYLATELRGAGWQPADGESYFQTYSLRDFAPQQARYHISINGIKLDSKDFYFLPFGMDPGRTPVQHDLVFAGYGIYAPEKGVDDFAGVDIKNKAVVSLFGAPWELDPHVIHAYDRAVGKSIHVTVRKGALLVYVSEEFESSPDSPASAEVAFFREMAYVDLAYLPEFQGKPTIGMGPVLGISPDVFDKTLAEAADGTYAQWKERLIKGKHKAHPLKAAIDVHIQVKPKESKASNVVALLRGSDPSLRDEWIVLTAHYDHLGYHEVPEGQDGIWNGADDNASGTAAVLEIARRLAEGKPPRRSILVVLTSGEERGLLGSAHYSIHPLIPKDKVIININVDMVGRSTGKVYCISTGCEDIYKKTAEIGKKIGVTSLPDPFPTWRLVYLIDSYHFARLDVPFIQFMTEFHKDYHQPSDEISHIQFEELGKIFEVMYELADYYAQGGERPALKRPQWFLTVN